MFQFLSAPSNKHPLTRSHVAIAPASQSRERLCATGLIGLALLMAVAPRADCEDAELPFSIELGEPFAIDGLPALQSYAAGQADVDGIKWLLVSGRHSGLHEFVEPTVANDAENDFPGSGDNDHLWVVDIVNRKTWRRALKEIQHIDTDPLSASNCLSCQVGGQLFVAGGYGESRNADTTGKMVTFDTLTAIHVARVVQAIMEGNPIQPADIQQIHDPALRVTGGGMLPLDGYLYMAFGQRFDGLYSPLTKDSESIFFQEYTQQVRQVTWTLEPELSAKVERFPDFDIGQVHPEDPSEPYRRRDLTVAPAISPTGKNRIAAYGGVFRPGTFDGFTEPVYIDGIKPITFVYQGQPMSYPSFSPGVDKSAQQLLSQYDCARLELHNGRTGNMFTVFFGGISAYHYDREADKLVKDEVVPNPNGGQPYQDGMPFVKTVSILQVDQNSKTEGFITLTDLPGYLGSESILLVDPAVSQYDNGVLRLDGITEPIVAGHIFGGIESTAPYTTGPKKEGERARTSCYRGFIPVSIVPKPSTVRRMPPTPSP